MGAIKYTILGFTCVVVNAGTHPDPLLPLEYSIP